MYQSAQGYDSAPMWGYHYAPDPIPGHALELEAPAAVGGCGCEHGGASAFGAAETTSFKPTRTQVRVGTLLALIGGLLFGWWTR